MIDVNTKRETAYQAKAKEVYAAENKVPTREELKLEPITSVTRIHSNYYKAPNSQPAGADAPIFNSAGGNSSASDSQSYDYQKDIHNPKTNWWDRWRG